MAQTSNFVSESQFESVNCPVLHTFKALASGARQPHLFANWLAPGNTKRSIKGIAKSIAKGITE